MRTKITNAKGPDAKEAIAAPDDSVFSSGNDKVLLMVEACLGFVVWRLGFLGPLSFLVPETAFTIL
jgi:hypothetical protein